MNDKLDNSNPRDENLELLTSYLDGELSDHQQTELEDRLAEDDSLRAQLKNLQRTWDLLDELPRPAASHSFTQSTMEMVVQDATRELTQAKSHHWSWIMRTLAMVALPIIAFSGAAFTTDYFQNAKHREIVNNLEILENVYYYDDLGDIEFLKNLAAKGMFTDTDSIMIADIDDVETPLLGQDYEQKQQRLKAMDAKTMDQLRRKKNRFDELKSERQAQVRQFHESLANHSDSKNLAGVMVRYHRWLKDLKEADRVKILDAPTQKRLQLIRAIKNEQEERMFGMVGETAVPLIDRSFVIGWMNYQVFANKKDEIQRLAFQAYRNRESEIRSGAIKLPPRNSAGQGRMFVDVLLLLDPDTLAELLYEDLNQFRQFLSAAGDQILDRDEEEQKRLLLQWLRAALHSQVNVTDKQMMAFFESLPEEEKEELNDLEPERRRVQLRQRLLEERKKRIITETDDFPVFGF